MHQKMSTEYSETRKQVESNLPRVVSAIKEKLSTLKRGQESPVYAGQTEQEYQDSKLAKLDARGLKGNDLRIVLLAQALKKQGLPVHIVTEKVPVKLTDDGESFFRWDGPPEAINRTSIFVRKVK